MPLKPGIYIFKNPAGDILYVGKAKSLRLRVRSYFAPPTKLGPKTAALVAEISTLEHIEVTSEVEALLLESRLIKKFRPAFNIAAKDDKSPYYIHITKEVFPRPVINHVSTHSVAGPFLSGYLARKLLKHFRQITPYCLAPRPVRRPCFYSHLGVCDPCPGSQLTPPQILRYRRNISRLRRLLSGQFAHVASELKKTMAESARRLDYEQATVDRDHLAALDYLFQLAIPPEEYLLNPNLAVDLRHQAIASLQSALDSVHLHLPSLQRIELFDVAHLRGDSATAAMTVCLAGDLTPAHYRHFTIKTAKSNSDVAMLAEALQRRRMRSDWPPADLIILNGGLHPLFLLNT